VFVQVAKSRIITACPSSGACVDEAGPVCTFKLPGHSRLAIGFHSGLYWSLSLGYAGTPQNRIIDVESLQSDLGAAIWLFMFG
jgi:hypothetical protein